MSAEETIAARERRGGHDAGHAGHAGDSIVLAALAFAPRTSRVSPLCCIARCSSVEQPRWMTHGRTVRGGSEDGGASWRSWAR